MYNFQNEYIAFDRDIYIYLSQKNSPTQKNIIKRKFPPKYSQVIRFKADNLFSF